MTEELDPQLARWFAQAEQRLTDADFIARVVAVHRRELGLAGPLRIGAVVWRGLAGAMALPLRHRPALAGLAAAVAAAITVGLVLQG